MTDEPCDDCQPGGEFQWAGRMVYAYTALCEKHAKANADYWNGYMAGYDAARGEGAFRRDNPEHFDGMVAT